MTDDLILEKVRVACLEMVGPQLLDDMEIEAASDLITGALVYRLSTFILRHPLGRMEVSYPATAWDHFKQSWAPRWFLRRHPVRLHWVVKSASAVFPFSHRALPRELGSVRYTLEEAVAS